MANMLSEMLTLELRNCEQLECVLCGDKSLQKQINFKAFQIFVVKSNQIFLPVFSMWHWTSFADTAPCNYVCLADRTRIVRQDERYVIKISNMTMNDTNAIRRDKWFFSYFHLMRTINYLLSFSLHSWNGFIFLWRKRGIFLHILFRLYA